jgi:hypothetical protein
MHELGVEKGTGRKECRMGARQSFYDFINIDGVVKSFATRHPGEGRGSYINDSTG